MGGLSVVGGFPKGMFRNTQGQKIAFSIGGTKGVRDLALDWGPPTRTHPRCEQSEHRLEGSHPGDDRSLHVRTEVLVRFDNGVGHGMDLRVFRLSAYRESSSSFCRSHRRPRLAWRN